MCRISDLIVHRFAALRERATTARPGTPKQPVRATRCSRRRRARRPVANGAPFPQVRFVGAMLVAAALAAIAGCGSDRAECVPVSGRVLLDGNPLTTGFLRVLPKGARGASAPIGADGSFTLTTYEEGDGCVLGTHPIAVIATEEDDGSKTHHTPQPQRWLIPKRYGNPQTSDLSIEISGPREDVVIELSSR